MSIPSSRIASTTKASKSGSAPVPATRTKRVPLSSPGRVVASSTQAAEAEMASRRVMPPTVPQVQPNPNPHKEDSPFQNVTTVAPQASSESVAVTRPNMANRGCQLASATPTDPKAVNSTTANAV